MIALQSYHYVKETVLDDYANLESDIE